PVTPTSSVAAAHDRLTCVEEMAFAVRFAGVVGAVVSVEPERIVNVSMTSPLLQVTSFRPPPAGPQTNWPVMPLEPNVSFSKPWCMKRFADHEGSGQVSQRQLVSSSNPDPPVPTVRWVTPCSAYVRS